MLDRGSIVTSPNASPFEHEDVDGSTGICLTAKVKGKFQCWAGAKCLVVHPISYELAAEELMEEFERANVSWIRSKDFPEEMISELTNHGAIVIDFAQVRIPAEGDYVHIELIPIHGSEKIQTHIHGKIKTIHTDNQSCTVTMVLSNGKNRESIRMNREWSGCTEPEILVMIDDCAPIV